LNGYTQFSGHNYFEFQLRCFIEISFFTLMLSLSSMAENTKMKEMQAMITQHTKELQVMVELLEI